MKKCYLWFVCIFALSLTLCLSVAKADLLEGLVAAWTFDDGTARDQTGNGHDGEMVGAPESVKGKFGLAMDFNGSDTGIEIADHEDLQLTEPFTVSAWIYPRSVQDHAGIVWKGSMIGWGSDVYNYRIALQGTNGLTWGACTGPVEGYFATGGVLTALDEWHHVVLVEDGEKGIAYLDGETGLAVTGGDANRPAAPYAPLEGHPVRIGWAMGVGGNVDSEAYVDGMIDEVLLYNRPMEEEEVLALMATSAPLAVAPKGKLTTTWAAIRK